MLCDAMQSSVVPVNGQSPVGVAPKLCSIVVQRRPIDRQLCLVVLCAILKFPKQCASRAALSGCQAMSCPRYHDVPP